MSSFLSDTSAHHGEIGSADLLSFWFSASVQASLHPSFNSAIRLFPQ
jgi:hypothetical protein